MLNSEELKVLRLVHNVTQQELGDAIGTSKNYISCLETGKKRYTEEQYNKIVNAIYQIAEDKKLKSEKVGNILLDVNAEVKKEQHKQLINMA